MKNKLSLPLLFGIILASLDFAFWTWFTVFSLLNGGWGTFGEALWGMMIVHAPSSLILVILGSLFSSPLGGSSSVVIPALLIFIFGIIQYFIIGYLLGKLILFIKSIVKKMKA